MAVTVRVRRVANPQRRKKKRRNARRRKLTPRQIKFFGTKRQKAALKASRKRKCRTARPRRAARRVLVVANPRRRVKAKRRRRAVRRTRRPSRNPALVVTLGSVNPKKRRRAKVARRRKAVRKRKANPSRRRTRRRNATRVVVVAPRSRRNRRVGRRRRRNPELFGVRAGGIGSIKMILGGLIGVAAAKFLPTIVPVGIVGTSNVIRVVLTGAAAYVSGMLAERVVDKQTAGAVYFGGMMQTGSVALNWLLPSVGQQIGLTGLGDLVAGQFPIPQNPLRLPPAPVPTQARVNMSGLYRAFGSAF